MAPSAEVQPMREVLADPAIGNFTVDELANILGRDAAMIVPGGRP